MAQTVEQALRQVRFVADGQVYRLLRLPPNAITAAAGVLAEIGEPFSAVIADPYEVTLIVPADAVDDFVHRLPGYQLSESVFRLVTLDVVLEHNLVGFIARIAAALSAAQISVMPYAAFSRDHLLVAARDLDRALDVLNRLQAES